MCKKKTMKTHKFQINALNVIAIGLLLSNIYSSIQSNSNIHSSNNNHASAGIWKTMLTMTNTKNSEIEATKIGASNSLLLQNCNNLFYESPTAVSSNNSRHNISNYKSSKSQNKNLPEVTINEIIKNLQGTNCDLYSTTTLAWSPIGQVGAPKRDSKCSKVIGRNWTIAPQMSWNEKGTNIVKEVSNKLLSEKKIIEKGEVPKAFVLRKLHQEQVSEVMAHKRAKRFIIFNGSGIVKFVFGTSFPVMLVDKQRSVTVINNLQMQYTPPPRPLYWWSFTNTSYFAARRSARQTTLVHDASRSYIYTAVEQMLESKGISGTACLMKAICVVAQQPLEGHSIFHALLNAIFTPAAKNIDAKYLNAQAAGRYGADCAQTFSSCPKNNDWLQGVTFHEYQHK